MNALDHITELEKERDDLKAKLELIIDDRDLWKEGCQRNARTYEDAIRSQDNQRLVILDLKAKLEEAEERCQSVSVLHRSNGWKSPEEYEALQKENESLRVEYESRVVWIENMNKILGYDNSDGFHSEPDPHAIAMALRRKNESLSREWDIMRAALQIIAQDIGSNHAATKAKEALSALVKEGE